MGLVKTALGFAESFDDLFILLCLAAGNDHVEALAYMYLHFRHEFDVGRAMDLAMLWDAHGAQEWLVDNAGASYGN